jgi:capsular polysaccharide biosynthesis protein
MVAPEPPPGPVARVPGRHLWAGQLWEHFGHFLCESLSRVWAAGPAGGVESLVFIPKRPGKGRDPKRYQQELLRLLGVEVPVRVVTEPTEFEELVVPGQGFGLGRIERGTPEMQALCHSRLREIPAEGPARLYLSRSALGGVEGGALLEQVLEANLAREGYEVFHPEKYPVATQIARYRAASHVVGLDGSAFHLFGMVAQPEQKAAIVLRRTSKVSQSLRHQIAAFSGRDPEMIDALVADWVPERSDHANRDSFGQLDFGVVARTLAGHGYVDDPDGWQIPKFREFVRDAMDLGQRLGRTFERHRREQPGTGAATDAQPARSN